MSEDIKQWVCMCEGVIQLCLLKMSWMMRIGMRDRNSNYFSLLPYPHSNTPFLLFVLHVSTINPHLHKHRNIIRRGIESEKWGEKWEEGLIGGWNGTLRRVWNDEQSMYIVPNTILRPYGWSRVNRDSCDSSFLVVLLSSLHSVLHTRVIAIHFGCDWGGLNWESRQSVINRGKPSKTILLR